MSVQEATGLANVPSRSSEKNHQISCHRHQVVTEVVLTGELDRQAMTSLEQVLDTARGSGARMIVIDLRELTSIDPAAFPTLARADAFCFDSAIRLRLLSRGDDRPEPVARALASA